MGKEKELKTLHVLRATDLRVQMVIGTDSHLACSLDKLKFGVAVANPDWSEPKYIGNTMSLEEFVCFINVSKSECSHTFTGRVD